jgi:hypothetical protein
MKVRLFAFAAIVASSIMSAHAQHVWNFTDTWVDGMTYLDWDYSGDMGGGPPAAAINLNFTEINNTHDTWIDFHFDIHNFLGNVTFVGAQDGGKVPGMSWNQFIAGSGTPNASIMFFDPGGLSIAPGDTFYANLNFLVDLGPHGEGHFEISWYPTVVPEPNAMAGIGIAAAGMLGLRRRRK